MAYMTESDSKFKSIGLEQFAIDLLTMEDFGRSFALLFSTSLDYFLSKVCKNFVFVVIMVGYFK